MAVLVTKRDIPMRLWGVNVVIPKGAQVKFVKDADGIKGDLFAVASTQLLVALTGNRHDPFYRYAWVEAEDVTNA